MNVEIKLLMLVLSQLRTAALRKIEIIKSTKATQLEKKTKKKAASKSDSINDFKKVIQHGQILQSVQKTLKNLEISPSKIGT